MSHTRSFMAIYQFAELSDNRISASTWKRRRSRRRKRSFGGFRVGEFVFGSAQTHNPVTRSLPARQGKVKKKGPSQKIGGSIEPSLDPTEPDPFIPDRTRPVEPSLDPTEPDPFTPDRTRPVEPSLNPIEPDPFPCTVEVAVGCT
ncbi:hypothetical protein Pmani_026095 [Petrolisthes manimaculis]|uniref:Uncharacterized protein n=1 Tax=Petrolisthes manimaculis TaxID=1843537 RepID=A0AAE1TXR8_9EUCA|nr:hypothetical protein Pmani_026095 [Petrolisthes manimaculis]